jgi:zinc protease
MERTAVVVPGKEQADVAIAYPVQGVGAAGYYDFKMANAVLGEYGLMGKIGESVRQKQGLAYYAFSTVMPGKSQSLWYSRAGVDPGNVERAIESIVAVIAETLAAGFAADELDGTRQLLTGQLALQMQTNAGIAEMLLAIEEFDLGLDYVATYPELLAAVTPERALAALMASIDLHRIQIGVAGPG